MDAPGDEPLHDLGVLFVHGIGQSGRAETLLRFGEPLRACVEAIVEPAAAGSAAASVPTACLEPEAATGPARAELRISGAGGAHAESRWLLAEAWWAKKFPPPTFGEIVGWSFGVLPWTLIAHFDRRFRRIGFRVFHAFHGARRLRKILWLFIRWLAEGTSVTLALIFSPLMLAAIGFVVVLGLVPYTPIRRFAGAVQRAIAATIGDSFVFMHQRFTAAAICQSVTDDLEWLAARCRKLVVVAHSQGAAIAHRVLRGPVTAPCDTLFTFGSGLAKLAEIERTETSAGRPLLWAASASALFAAASFVIDALASWQAAGSAVALGAAVARAFIVVEVGSFFVIADLVGAARPQAGAKPAGSAAPWLAIVFILVSLAILGALEWNDALGAGASWRSVAAAAAFAGGMALAYICLRRWHALSGRSLQADVQWALDRELYRERLQFHNRRMRWYDVYASADPVPNGQLLDEFDPSQVYSYEIANAQSMLRDHTAYWDNRDDFVPRVARLLLDTAGLPSRPASPKRTTARRRWRVHWSFGARGVLAVLAIALAWCWIVDPPAVVGEIAQRVLAAFGTDHADKAASDGIAHWLAPLAAVGLLWTVASATVAIAWSSWNNDELAIGLGNRDFDLVPRRLLFFLALSSAWTAAGVWAVFGGLAAAAVVVVAILVGIALLTRGRAWLVVRSESGPSNELRRLRLAELRSDIDFAAKHHDGHELTRLGREARDFDEALAVTTLEQAIALDSANAAYALGLYYDSVERRATDEAGKAAARRRAIDAFGRGAAMGDAASAWWLAVTYRSNGDEDRAVDAFRRAYELKDVDAAHSLGLALERAGREDEAIEIFEEGTRRGDALSASFLAARMLERARAARASDPAAFVRLQARALELYQTAFDLGDTDSARKAGNMCRELSDVAGARRNYLAGARLRDALAALRLGQLEDEVEQNADAARAAYDWTIRLDAGGPLAATARFHLGRLLEAEGKSRAAMQRYRDAMGAAGTPTGSADAAVALARLMEADHPIRDEVRDVYRRGLALDPRVAAVPFAQYLERTYDAEEASRLVAAGTDGLPAEARWRLGRVLRHTNRSAARDLFSRALDDNSPDAAVDLYELLSLGSGNDAPAVLDRVLAKESWFAGIVADRFETAGRVVVARELRERAKNVAPRAG